ncbi:MAG: 30S ribosomal protein S10 [Candidatus Abawacabacteria bacterium RBG_16_42_10]|uniref:Small ribosomal subunit protein uS10 n=2 Tax=Bacteria TaxID=2 RepID=A0A0H4T0X4_9BACT|nr:30S ribosomal protein S10, small subunit ribosomal protein S10 [uncultured bacterium Rifle_16ft_4_minimus_15147]OGC81384.1 MAG: 30S ribosomal protein S10 [Candidatus Abawacabacteria bacterium RBG_16_42_10]
MTAAGAKIRIKIKAYDHRVIDAAARVIIETTERTGALIAGPIPLPTKIRKFTVLKSTFVHKDARDQFEIRTHKRIIDITESTSKTIDALSNITLPAGVEIEVKMLTA